MYAIRSYYVERFPEVGIAGSFRHGFVDADDHAGIGAERDHRLQSRRVDRDDPVEPVHRDRVLSDPELVITSYSIHYTKLYEPSASR